MIKNKNFDFETRDYDKLTISQLKRQADYFLRQFLLRNEGNYIKCPIKNKHFHVSNIEVAHFIDRNCMHTRYDLINCHLISKQSNTWDAQTPKEGYKSLHHYEYEQWLGEETVKHLREKSKIVKIFSREDYIEIIENFRNE